MEQPVICVIVPVYKAEATLPRCIESVLTQQLPGGLRLILVDDQSPDRSGEICDATAPQGTRGFRRAQCRATGRHRRVYCIFGQ